MRGRTRKSTSTNQEAANQFLQGHAKKSGYVQRKTVPLTNSYSEDQGWEFHISYPHDQQSLNKAAKILTDVFIGTNLNFQCLALNDAATNLQWDGAEFGSVQDQRGKEFSCSLRYDSTLQEFEGSIEFIKQLMLLSWRKLLDAGIQVGYTTTPIGDRAISIEGEPLFSTPFSYTAKNLDSQNKPLQAMQISQEDLKNAGITFDDIKKMQASRLEYLEDHHITSLKAIKTRLMQMMNQYQMPNAPTFLGRLSIFVAECNKFKLVVQENNQSQHVVSTQLKQLENKPVKTPDDEVAINLLKKSLKNTETEQQHKKLCSLFDEMVAVYPKNFEDLIVRGFFDEISTILSKIGRDDSINADMLNSFLCKRELIEIRFSEQKQSKLLAFLDNPRILNLLGNNFNLQKAFDSDHVGLQKLYLIIIHYFKEEDVLALEHDIAGMMKTKNPQVKDGEPNTALMEYALHLLGDYHPDKKGNISEMELLYLLQLQGNVSEPEARRTLDIIYGIRLRTLFQTISTLNNQVGVFGGEKIIHRINDSADTQALKVSAGVAEIEKAIQQGLLHHYPKSSILDQVIHIGKSHANKTQGRLNKRQEAVSSFYTSIISLPKPKMMEIEGIPLKLITKGDLEKIISNYHQRSEGASLFAHKGTLKRIFNKKTQGIKEIEDFLNTPEMATLNKRDYLEGEVLLTLLKILNERNDRVAGTSRSYEKAPNKATNVAYYSIYDKLESGLTEFLLATIGKTEDGPYFKAVETCLNNRKNAVAHIDINEAEDRMVAESADSAPPSRRLK